ncbi:MAG: hypothetical protein ACK4GT_00420 [Pararhodobacter sp.]
MKAVIHIGTPKSGTTTIQAFLSLNREALTKQGFRYQPFDSKNLAQLELALAGLVRSGGLVEAANKMHALGVRTEAEQIAYVDSFEAMLRDGVRDWPEHTYIASSEQVHSWLSARSRVKALHAMLSTHFNPVQYIVYYRRQEDFILSTYSERIRRGERLTFEQHFDQRVEKMDFHRRAMMWAEIVGRENLTVRLLDSSEMLNGDLMDDFCTACGIDRSPLQDPPRMNVSLSAEEMNWYLRLGRRVPARLKSGAPNPLFFFLMRLVRKRLPKPGSRINLTEDQRARLQAIYASSNERLRAEFFPHRATLFGAP